MIKKSIVIVAVVFVISGVGLFFLAKHRNVASIQATNIVTSTTLSNQVSSTAMLFANSQYVTSSYLISTTSTYNTATQRALKGFQVKKQTFVDGSLKITLIALQSEYSNQTYLVKPGEQLYFMEASSADDSISEDHAPADDRAILVSANGIIL